MVISRKELGDREGQRFRCRAIVSRFGSKRGWNGTVPTVLLQDVRDVRSGALLTDHLWFTTGRWSATLRVGDHFEFDARVSQYVKGYQGRRDVPNAPVSRDWRLERPTKVMITKRGLTESLKKLKEKWDDSLRP